MRSRILLVTAGGSSLEFIETPDPVLLPSELRDDGNEGTLRLELEPRDHDFAVLVESASTKRRRAVLGIEVVDDRGVAATEVERHSFALPPGSSNELAYAIRSRRSRTSRQLPVTNPRSIRRPCRTKQSAMSARVSSVSS